jgi:hypothetical protein
MSDILFIKKEVLNTMSTRGWHLIKERADAVILDMSNKAIDEEDKDKSETLVTEARAAKKFWTRLQQSLQSSTQVDSEGSEDWYEVADS